MKHKSWFPKALSAAVLTAALCLPVAAEAGPETARAQIWNRHMRVDDVLWVAFLDEEGRSLYPLAMEGGVHSPALGGRVAGRKRDLGSGTEHRGPHQRGERALLPLPVHPGGTTGADPGGAGSV